MKSLIIVIGLTVFLLFSVFLYLVIAGADESRKTKKVKEPAINDNNKDTV